MRGSRRGWGEVGSTPFETKFNFGHRVHSTESRENRDGNSRRKMSLAVTRSSSSSSPPSPQPPTTTTTITTITLDDSTLGRRLIRVEQVIYLFISFRYFSFGIFSKYRVERSWLGFKNLYRSNWREERLRDLFFFFFCLRLTLRNCSLEKGYSSPGRKFGEIYVREKWLSRVSNIYTSLIEVEKYGWKGGKEWGRKGMRRVSSFGKITVGLLIDFIFFFTMLALTSHLFIVDSWRSRWQRAVGC